MRRVRARICVSRLSAGPLGEHTQPVANHGEDGGKVGQTEHDPQPHERFEEQPASVTTIWTHAHKHTHTQIYSYFRRQPLTNSNFVSWDFFAVFVMIT